MCKVKVVNILGEKEGILRQMENMGIYAGSDIYVVDVRPDMLSIRAKGSTYAIHRSLCEKVEVTI